MKQLHRDGLKVENYQITVDTSDTSILVTFDDASRAVGQRGSSPRLPGFEVEVNAATLTILRSDFAK